MCIVFVMIWDDGMGRRKVNGWIDLLMVLLDLTNIDDDGG